MQRTFAALLIFCVAPLAASASPITVPTDLPLGASYRLVFVTSTTRDATSFLIADYNAFVTGVANGVPELAALGTTWTAIASTSTVAARDNTGTNPSSLGVPIYRLDDTRIANANADLWDGSLAASFSIVESGLPIIPIVSVVWTGTNSDGTPAGTTHLGAGMDHFALLGYTIDSIVVGWVDGSAIARNFELFPMYAISAELTVVPEPSSLFLVGIGATVVLGWQLGRRRRRKRQ